MSDTPALAALDGSVVEYRVVRTPVAESPEESAELQGIPLSALLRTLVVRRGDDDYIFVLVPGGRRFDWPKLRAHLGVKRLSMPSADEAREVTGYERGAITPFGSRRPSRLSASTDSAARAKSRTFGAAAPGVATRTSNTYQVRFIPSNCRETV